MAFPLNPTNGEQTTQNGIVYTYNSALGVWSVLTVTSGDFGANNITAINTVSGAVLTATGNVGGANVVATNSISSITVIASGNVSANNISATNSISSDTVTAVGNISGSYFIGNGSQLTGIAGGGSNYTNANVEAYLPTYTGNLTSLTGNVVTTANVSGDYFIGNGSQLTGITAGTSYTNANVEAYLPTYTGNLASLQGNVTTTANVSGNFFIGNGSQLTGITAGGGDGGVANSGVFLNAQTITANVNISNVYNGFSIGPLTLEANVVVTQAAGSKWVIL